MPTLNMGKVRESYENPKQKNAPALEEPGRGRVKLLILRKNFFCFSSKHSAQRENMLKFQEGWTAGCSLFATSPGLLLNRNTFLSMCFGSPHASAHSICNTPKLKGAS